MEPIPAQIDQQQLAPDRTPEWLICALSVIPGIQ
jgi:hypothetical protein